MRIAGYALNILIERLHSLFVVDSPDFEWNLIGLAECYCLGAIVAGVDEDFVAAIAEGDGHADRFWCDFSHKIADAGVWTVCEDLLEAVVLEADVGGAIGKLVFGHLLDDVSCLLRCDALLDLDVWAEMELLTEC